MFNVGDLKKFYDVETGQYLAELEVLLCEDIPEVEGAFCCHFKAVTPSPLKKPDQSLDYLIRDPNGAEYIATLDATQPSVETWVFTVK